jgi:hypothetical protein
MSNIEKLRAVAAKNTENKPAAIAAAVDKQLYAMSRTLSQAGVELNSVGKISASTLSKKLKESGVESQRRLEVKVALVRAGLLSD